MSGGRVVPLRFGNRVRFLAAVRLDFTFGLSLIEFQIVSVFQSHSLFQSFGHKDFQ